MGSPASTCHSIAEAERSGPALYGARLIGKPAALAECPADVLHVTHQMCTIRRALQRKGGIKCSEQGKNGHKSTAPQPSLFCLYGVTAAFCRVSVQTVPALVACRGQRTPGLLPSTTALVLFTLRISQTVQPKECDVHHIRPKSGVLSPNTPKTPQTFYVPLDRLPPAPGGVVRQGTSVAHRTSFTERGRKKGKGLSPAKTLETTERRWGW